MGMCRHLLESPIQLQGSLCAKAQTALNAYQVTGAGVDKLQCSISDGNTSPHI